MVVGNFPLANKIAVVTGGGSGINLAFVKLALGELYETSSNICLERKN